MSSNDVIIQNFYDKIKNYRVDEKFPNKIQLNDYIHNLFGTSIMYNSQTTHYRSPFKCIKKKRNNIWILS